MQLVYGTALPPSLNLFVVANIAIWPHANNSHVETVKSKISQNYILILINI